MNKINKAIEFAKIKHKDCIDDNGKPFFNSHIIPVGNILSELTDDEDIICAGLLHDTIEDTNTTYEELEQEFGKRVADLVYECTHEGSKDHKGYYFPRLKSKDAIVIKFADRLSNLSRMDCWDEKRQQQFIKRSKFWKTEV